MRTDVAVVDAGQPRKPPRERRPRVPVPRRTSRAKLLAPGRRDVEHHGEQVAAGDAQGAQRATDGLDVSLADGRLVRARRPLGTIGLVDEAPDVPGLRERWGRDVLHCAYCHGWGSRDQPVGVLSTGAWGIHQALLFRQWTPELVLFTHTGPAPTPEEAEQLAALDIRVVPGVVDSLEVVDDRLPGVRLAEADIIAEDSRRAVTAHRDRRHDAVLHAVRRA